MKKLIIISIVLIVSCKSENRKDKKNPTQPVLMYETEHCRVYCLQQNGWGRCLTAISECDSGYSMNIDISK